MILAILKKFPLEYGVGKMCTVPRENVVHPVQNGQSKVRSVRVCPRRKLKKADEVGFQLSKSLWDVQNWDAGKKRHPPGSGTRITTAGLISCEDRSVETETRPLMVPPVVRSLLINGDLRLAAAVSGQIAWNRSLNVNALHCKASGYAGRWFGKGAIRDPLDAC